MKPIIINDVEVSLVARDGLVFANSLDVAKVFGKRHDNVIATIRKMSERGLLNFKESSYWNEQNREMPFFEMNRDGFTFLVMGFTGEKAENFKLDFIDGFNALEKEVRTLQNPQTNQIQFLQGMLDAIGTMDSRVTTLEQNRRLENWQEKELLDLKNKKVYELCKKHDFENDEAMIKKLHSRVWNAFKKHFKIPRYNELPCLKFEDGKQFINNIKLSDIL